MIAYLIGIVLAVVTVATGALLRLEKRTFYSTIAIVVATYYVLFAVVAGTTHTLALDALIAMVFIVLVIIGARYDVRLVALALVLHALLDVFHGDLVPGSGVPAWWPAFCLAYDLTAAALLYVMLRRKNVVGVVNAP